MELYIRRKNNYYQEPWQVCSPVLQLVEMKIKERVMFLDSRSLSVAEVYDQ